ncbi:MAG: hypothetical protein AVDCRST_MAG16-2287 [uncultured Frankineae bacterium]|uniref:Uncharacterized protein n=1 Tax=uncultured Frankineae bacterium TaxID=437475 RepID=A0A6J4M9A1_9ACTN|nr:MAG: hypothetical protein AVDCRST_MAG16-2287 [uncultured Frankineae bacterium]
MTWQVFSAPRFRTMSAMSSTMASPCPVGR